MIEIFFANFMENTTVKNLENSSTSVKLMNECIVAQFLLRHGVGRHSTHQNVQLFIRCKNDILNAAVFKQSLHKIRET